MPFSDVDHIGPYGDPGSAGIKATAYDSSTPWATDPHLLKRLRELLAGPIGRVVDAGGGTGIVARYLSAAPTVTDVVVVDPSQSMLDQVPDRIRSVRSTFEEFNDELPYNTVIARQVLHYAKNPVNFCRRAADLLEPSGRLYVGQLVAPSIAASDWLQKTAQAINPGRRRIFTVGSLIASVETAGFALRSIETSRYSENVESWVRRAGCQEPEQVAADSAARLTPDVAAALHTDGTGDHAVSMLWVHAVFARV